MTTTPADAGRRVYFGNFLNELMVSVQDERHGRGLVAVAPRMVWLTSPGDVLVLPSRPTDAFWRYATGLLGMDPQDVVVVAESSGLDYLSDTVAERPGTATLRAMLAERGVSTMVPFALDRRAVATARDLGLGIDGYAGDVSDRTLDCVYRVNTKSGFHALADKFGLPTVPWTHCHSPAEVAAAVSKRRDTGTGSVVKLNRSSNGFGIGFFPLANADGDGPSLDAHLASLADQPHDWIVEDLVRVDDVLTVEMWSTPEGGRLVHTGEMLTPDGKFSGQITPPRNPHPAYQELAEHGIRWGDHLAAAGYRGPYDLDAVLSDGQLLVTESNVRRTGTTYLEFLVQRLRPDGDVVWLADSRPGTRDLDFAAALDALASASVLFDGRTGVVLTADTTAVDGRWRYLVLGDHHDHVFAQLGTVERILGTS